MRAVLGTAEAVVSEIVHVDMDAFYASVEVRDRPELRGRPVVVGGPSRRGVVLAASYEARRFGVRSAMPMAAALRASPELVVVPPRFGAYVEASRAVFAILESYTPLVEPLSLDEAYLDVTASFGLFGDGRAIAEAIRARVRAEVDLPCSAGVAPSKLVAKIASDLAKPNGLRVVAADAVLDFLAPLSVQRLPGIGRKTEARLAKLGIVKVLDLIETPRDRLERELGPHAAELLALARGVDDRPVVPDREAKSLGAEDTFEVDVGDREALARFVHAQALRVARRLRALGLVARVVVLKLKDPAFRVTTRQRTLPEPTDDGQALYAAARALLDESPPRARYRLTGVSAHDLGPPPAQGSLFAGERDARRRLNQALDAIAGRFGTGAISTADLAEADPRLRDTRPSSEPRGPRPRR